MSQTVIGFFKDHSEAQQALEQLQSRGISRDRVDITKGSNALGVAGSRSATTSGVNPVSGSERDENSVSRTADDRTVDREGRNTNVFTDFFNNLFGGKDHDEQAGRYRHVAERSGAMVTVHAQSAEEAERAADILDSCGAVDVNESAAQTGYVHSGSTSSRGDSIRQRSRIFDRKLDDHIRLRSTDDDLGRSGGDI